jgi:hypothetical protein
MNRFHRSDPECSPSKSSQYSRRELQGLSNDGETRRSFCCEIATIATLESCHSFLWVDIAQWIGKQQRRSLARDQEYPAGELLADEANSERVARTM